MPYEWEEWGLAALVGTEPYEVRQVLDGKVKWPRPALDPRAGLPVLTIWGRTNASRALIVGVHRVSGFTWKIIGAREMTGDELTEFTRWEETR